ncbi:MAG: hypothetical protein AB7P04_05205 [Bacteriovoracia bacterium]
MKINFKSSSPVLGAAIALVAFGCASASKTLSPTASGELANQRALDLAFSEMDARARRGVASIDQDLQPYSNQFDKLRNRVQYLVFPKVSKITEKRPQAGPVEFGAPVRFDITSRRLVECTKLQKEAINDLHHQAFFAAGDLADKKCAVLNYRPTRAPAKGDLKPDDVTSVRLYLDSDYRAHGTDIVKFVARGDEETYGVKFDPEDASSSGLLLFPTDVPRLLKGDNYKGVRAFQMPADPFVTKRAARENVGKKCDRAGAFEYRDAFGNRVKAQWCAGDPLPTTIDNQKFFAILI